MKLVDGVPKFTMRELMVVGVYVDGHSIKETAEAFDITYNTVQSYAKRITKLFRKAGYKVQGRDDLRRALQSLGYLPDDYPNPLKVILILDKVNFKEKK